MGVTPERFRNEQFLTAWVDVSVSLFVVDEAHYISDWGHSFRPSYLALQGAIERLGRPPMLAVTATGTPWIREEIIDRLGLRRPRVVARGLDRASLFFEVVRVEAEREDRHHLRRLLTEPTGDYSDEINAGLDFAMTGCGIVS